MTFSQPPSIISIVLKSAFKKEGYGTIFGGKIKLSIHLKVIPNLEIQTFFFSIKFVFFCFDCTAIILIKLFFHVFVCLLNIKIIIFFEMLI